MDVGLRTNVFYSGPWCYADLYFATRQHHGISGQEFNFKGGRIGTIGEVGLDMGGLRLQIDEDAKGDTQKQYFFHDLVDLNAEIKMNVFPSCVTSLKNVPRRQAGIGYLLLVIGVLTY